MNPLLIDFFCSAGGTSMGYSRAGFDVIGVDIAPQPRYPFPFILGDALDVLQRLIDGEGIEASDGRTIYLSDVAVIAASPPCQRYSDSAYLPNVNPNNHPDLVAPTRKLLRATGKPYIIENVEGAPLENPIMLCGTMFPGLLTIRHRLFETYPEIWFPPAQCCHWGKTEPIMAADKKRGGIKPGDETHLHIYDFVTVAGNNGLKADYETALGINWMSKKELSQAIPPAYTHWLGEQMRSILKI